MKKLMTAVLLWGVIAGGIYGLGQIQKGKTFMTEKQNPKGRDSKEMCSLPPDDAALRKILTPEQYRIIREKGTEAPFLNAYWNNKKPGLYVDIVTGEPLFSSTDKFDSGTGWPSFTAPVRKDALAEKKDTGYGMTRIEVRAQKSDSHLGHVFNDGPGPTGLRYCINSAALRFVPLENFEKEGYGRYLALFQKEKKKE